MFGNSKIIFGFILVVLSVSYPPSNALTTFGKSPQNSNTPPPPPDEKVKECRYESECSIIANASCLADPKDKKTKCLCGDYSVPKNGRCVYKFKAVGAACNEDEECGELAECIDGDNTKVGKRCQCIDGFDEETFRCNGSSSLISVSLFILLSLFFTL